MRGFPAILVGLCLGVLGASPVAAVPAIDAPDGAFGGTITATITDSPYRFAHAQCVQGGRVVYEQWVRVQGGAATFQLGPTARWVGGDADCVADVGKLTGGRWTPIASDAFTVVG